ncbi:MAG: hypothetical protein VKL39_20665 [Leptolyngbyaceae bacterium]|nr:hypothetical protein [Leptolyngbyaceae bacterium]
MTLGEGSLSEGSLSEGDRHFDGFPSLKIWDGGVMEWWGDGMVDGRGEALGREVSDLPKDFGPMLRPYIEMKKNN